MEARNLRGLGVWAWLELLKTVMGGRYMVGREFGDAGGRRASSRFREDGMVVGMGWL